MKTLEVRATLDETVVSSVEEVLTGSGWTAVEVSARPDRLRVEEQLWRAVADETVSTPAIDALKAEGAELLAAMPHIQRFIATGRRAE